MKQAAVFLDRDNTIIADPGYLADPEAVELLPGAADAIRQWNESGYRVVVVTNQSGLARGLITERQLERIHQRMQRLLEAHNARLDAVYFCPYLDSPEAVIGRYRRDSHLRKPRPGMLQKAAADLRLDLSASWMVGDSATDVQAGISAGCRTILLDRGQAASNGVHPDFVVSSLEEAAAVVLEADSEPAGQIRDRESRIRPGAAAHAPGSAPTRAPSAGSAPTSAPSATGAVQPVSGASGADLSPVRAASGAPTRTDSARHAAKPASGAPGAAGSAAEAANVPSARASSAGGTVNPASGAPGAAVSRAGAASVHSARTSSPVDAGRPVGGTPASSAHPASGAAASSFPAAASSAGTAPITGSPSPSGAALSAPVDASSAEASPRSAASPLAPAPADTEMLAVLKEIRNLLQQQRRDAVQSDFSVLRLAATLLEMIAVAVVLWGLAALVGSEQPLDALIRFTLAGAVQLLALTMFMLDRSK